MSDVLDRESKVERAQQSQDKTSGVGSHSVRLDVYRPAGENMWEDAAAVVAGTYLIHKRIFEALAPYNAKQHSSNKPYVPPTTEFMKMAVKRKPLAVNDLTYTNMLKAIQAFCVEFKGCKQLVYPDPVTLHSAHFPEGTFKVEEVEVAEWYKLAGDRPYKPASVHSFKLAGLNSLVYVENYRPDNHKYLIMRPKLSKLGVPLFSTWEMLFFRKNYGYFVDRVDAELNPRWSGLAPSKNRKGF